MCAVAHYFSLSETDIHDQKHGETWRSLFVPCSRLASEGPTAPLCTAVTNQIQVSPHSQGRS